MNSTLMLMLCRMTGGMDDHLVASQAMIM